MKSLGLLSILFFAVFLVGEVATPQPAAVASRPLPSVPDLVHELQAHQKEVEAVRQNYIFTMDEDEQEPDGHGGFRTRETNTFEVRYTGPWTVRTLVAHNGQSLSAQDLKQNREESDKQMRLAEQSLTRLTSDPLAEGSSLRMSDFLAADQFVHMRRETYHGRTVLAFDFLPKPGFQPNNAREKFLKNLGGTILVDEEAVQLIRLEAHLLNNVNYGGFLASIKKGMAVILEQRRVNDEIWLPSRSEFHLDARAFLSSKHINIVQRYRDYHRFRVNTVMRPVQEGDDIPQ